MNNQDAIYALQGVRKGLQRRLSQNSAKGVATALLSNAVQRYGDFAVLSAYGVYAGIVANLPKADYHNAKGELVMRTTARNKYRSKIKTAKQSLRQAMGPGVNTPGSYQFELYNAMCGLESVFAGNYRMGVSLVFNHLAELDQQSLGTLAEHIAVATHFAEADATQTQMADILAALQPA
jgi:hypothetical protein